MGSPKSLVADFFLPFRVMQSRARDPQSELLVQTGFLNFGSNANPRPGSSQALELGSAEGAGWQPGELSRNTHSPQMITPSIHVHVAKGLGNR